MRNLNVTVYQYEQLLYEIFPEKNTQCALECKTQSEGHNLFGFNNDGTLINSKIETKPRSSMLKPKEDVIGKLFLDYLRKEIVDKKLCMED